MKMMKCGNCLKMIHPKDGEELAFCPFCGASLDRATVYEETVETKEENAADGTTTQETVRTTKTTGSYSFTRTETKTTGRRAGAPKKKGIVIFAILAVIFGIMFAFAADEGYVKAAVIAGIQFVAMIAAMLYRRGKITVPLDHFAALCMTLALALAIPFLYTVGGAADHDYEMTRQKQELNWPKDGLATRLPSPISDYGRVYTNTKLELDFEMYNISQTRYEAYVKSLMRKGYTNVDYQFATSFKASDEEGYSVYVWRTDDGEMNVTIESPQQYDYFDWPDDNELAAMLPEIDSPYGRIDADRSDSFNVTIGRTDEDEFKEYVRGCRENGFTSDYERTRHSYTAYDQTGEIMLFLEWNEKERYMSIYIFRVTDDMADGEVLPDEEETVIGSAEEMNNSYQDNGMLAFSDNRIYYLLDAEMKTVTKTDRRDGTLFYGTWEEGTLEDGVTVEYVDEDDNSFTETLAYADETHLSLLVTDEDGNEITLGIADVDSVQEHMQEHEHEEKHH